MLKSSVDVMALWRNVFQRRRISVITEARSSHPVLKKPGLDQTDVANHRPITNLSTMWKILEKLALRRLRPHVMLTGNFSEFQSAFRAGHSTGTTLLKVTNDVVTFACDGLTTVLLSLDISAAFHTINHNTLLDRVTHDFGIRGSALHLATVLHL